MAESDGLENRCGCMPTVGSNPTPSAEVMSRDIPDGCREASRMLSRRPSRLAG